MSKARRLASELTTMTEGRAGYWRVKALKRGLVHPETGHAGHKTTSRLERFDRELRRRERMGVGWTMHNPLVLFQKQGLLNSTT